MWAQAELAEFFILAGLVVLFVRAWLGWKPGLSYGMGGVSLGVVVWLLEAWVRQAGSSADSGDVLTQILLFFTKAGAFVFGSGLRSFHSYNREWFSNWLAQRASVLGCRSSSDDHAGSSRHCVAFIG